MLADRVGWWPGYHDPEAEGVPAHIAAARQRLDQQFDQHAGMLLCS